MKTLIDTVDFLIFADVDATATMIEDGVDNSENETLKLIAFVYDVTIDEVVEIVRQRHAHHFPI